MAAKDLEVALQKFERQKFDFQAIALTSAIDLNPTAKVFVKINDMNPVQIFGDLDNHFI